MLLKSLAAADVWVLDPCTWIPGQRWHAGTTAMAKMMPFNSSAARMQGPASMVTPLWQYIR